MQKNTMGILFILISGFCFTLMGLSVKLAGDLPSMQKILFRNIIALSVALAILVKSPGKGLWQHGNLPLLLLRSSLGTIGVVCNFYAVDHLILSDATILNKLAPFFAIILGRLFLKERVRLFQAICVIGAFLGAMLIVRPSFSNVQLMPYSIAVMGGFGAGGAYTCVRVLGNRGERTPVIVAFFSFFSTLVSLPFVIYDHAPMTGLQWLYLLLAGLSATGGQFAVTKAYTYAPAREISVFDYSQIVFASILSILVFSEAPDVLGTVGYGVICAMAILMFLHAKKQSGTHSLPG